VADVAAKAGLSGVGLNAVKLLAERKRLGSMPENRGSLGHARGRESGRRARHRDLRRPAYRSRSTSA